ncbi:hypothetical protein FH972_003532 [Carpinus fangiana]|uniref:Uncharacterized protein n=1 Tax=Carpinus fangiana TaxID=176857 RepID=A0A5N6QI87_9ROSI|nr:hypothetical protein FH972_003532 [Carpinus fangiana]
MGVGSGEAVLHGEDLADRGGRARGKREGLRAMVLPVEGVDRRPAAVPRLQGGLPLRPLRPTEWRHHRGQVYGPQLQELHQARRLR